MPEETITRSDRRPADETYQEALSAVESDLRDRHDVSRIKSVDASRTGGSGEWAAVVVAELVEE